MLQDNASDSDYNDAIAWSDRFYQEVTGNDSELSIGAPSAGKYILFADGNDHIHLNVDDDFDDGKKIVNTACLRSRNGLSLLHREVA